MPIFIDPPPQAALRALGPELVRVSAGTVVWRIYFRGGPYPTQWSELRDFGPLTTSRFDHHTFPRRHQARKIMYAAEDGPTCVAEVFQEARVVDRHARDPWLAGFTLARDVELHSLAGAWCTRAGTSMVINSGARGKARAWSRAIYGAFPNADGLFYCSSRNANQPAFAFYERARTAIPARPDFNRPLADPGLHHALRNAAARFGYALI